MQTKTAAPRQFEINRATRAIHDAWSPEERQRRRQMAACRQRELLGKLFLQVAVTAK